MPIAYLLLVSGMISSTITGHRSGAAYMRTFGRTIVFIVLLTFLVSWGNSVTAVVDSTVRDVLHVDPTKICADYQNALAMQKGAEGERSWWEKVFEWRASLLEAILTGIFYVLGWIAWVIVWWAYLLQTAILFIGYGLSPIFVGFLAFQSLHEVGKRFFLNLVGIMLWPLGWGVAGLVTQSMIDFMTARDFLHGPFAATDLYSLQNLMGAAFLGVWLIFSTIAAPVILQKAIATGSSAASQLFSGAFAAGRTAIASGATTFATAGSAAKGGWGMAAAGVMSAAAAFESLGTASLNEGYGGGSLVGSLTSMRTRNGSGRRNAPTSFPPNDPTGEKTVKDLIRRTRNPQSPQG